MNALRRVLIMAGGTGGHIFPGLAVAAYLREQGVEVHWLGTRQGLEARVVPASHIPLHFISIGGVRGQGIKKLLLSPFRVLMAVMQSVRVLFNVKPSVVIGLGGFVSGPGGLASWLLRYPLIIHEQNAKAGLTNKWLKPFSKKVLTGFPDVFPLQAKVVVTGNPVRAAMMCLLLPVERLCRRDKKMRLLVLGGSLGAQVINERVPEVLAALTESERPEVYHQTGEKHYEAACAAYQNAGVSAKIVPFIENMQDAYAWADLVLCRAGALTVAELCAVGVGAILVPYPFAVDDHQTINAKYLVDNGAAILIQQADLTVEKLVMVLKELYATPEKRMDMAMAAYRLRWADVPAKIYDCMLSVI